MTLPMCFSQDPDADPEASDAGGRLAAESDSEK